MAKTTRGSTRGVRRKQSQTDNYNEYLVVATLSLEGTTDNK
jgi:hypothetical protein